MGNKYIKFIQFNRESFITPVEIPLVIIHFNSPFIIYVKKCFEHIVKTLFIFVLLLGLPKIPVKRYSNENEILDTLTFIKIFFAILAIRNKCILGIKQFITVNFIHFQSIKFRFKPGGTNKIFGVKNS